VLIAARPRPRPYHQPIGIGALSLVLRSKVAYPELRVFGSESEAQGNALDS
jgi:hypothetical protein